MTQDQPGTTADRFLSRVLMPRQAVLIVALLAILVAILSFNSPSAALAQETSPISLEVEVGFDGKARVGNWIPVVVHLENQGSDLAAEIHVIGNRGHPMSSGSYVADVVLPRDGRKRLTLHVPYMTATLRLEVQLVADGEVVARLEPPVNIIGETDLFVGIVGQRAGSWNLLTTLELPGRGREVAVVAIAPDTFPQRPEVLDAFDVIALGDVSVKTLPHEILEALEGWVAGGGTLVLSGGSNAGGSLEGLPDRLMPVVVGDATELKGISALERLGDEPILTTLPIAVNSTLVISGRVLAKEGELPLAVLSTYGKGRVLFLTFDPAAQPLVGWPGLPQMWRELLFQSLPPIILFPDQVEGRSPGMLTATSQWPYQLHNAMSNLPALEFPSIKVLLGLIAGYVLLVGPANYLVLRWLRRPGLTWLTIPALVILFSSGIYLLAVRAKGSNVQASSVVLVQDAPDTDWARVRSMVGILSPSQADYRVEVPGSALVATWDSADRLYGSGLGSSGDMVKIRNREQESEVELLKMGMWTMRSLVSDRTQRVEETLSHDLYEEGSLLKGTVTNKGLFPLKQVWLVSTGAVEDLGALEPGEIATVDTKLSNFAGGLPSWQLREQLMFSSASLPGNVREERQRQQLHEMAISVLESFYIEPPSGFSILLLAWTDQSPMVVAVNGENPAGPSLTLFSKPISPHLRGSFSLPSGLLMGRAVNIEGQIMNTAPGLISFTGGSITFQFEAPAEVQEMERMALQVPFHGGSRAAQGVEALAYHWEDEAWEPLELKTVSLQVKSSFSGAPAPPQSVAGARQAVSVYISTPYEYTFREALEGAVGEEEGLAVYLSATGLVRIKLIVGGDQVGRPSLAIDGVAP